MDPATLITVARNTQAIANFVSGNGLKEAVSTIIGDVHLEAARLALDTSKVVNNPRDRINSVITHLEAAHVAFSHIHGRADKYFVRNCDFQSVSNAVAKDAWVCCIMALCYASLNEKRALEKYLVLGDNAFKNGEALERPLAMGMTGLATKLIAIANLRNWDFQDKVMTADMYSDFKTAIRASLSA